MRSLHLVHGHAGARATARERLGFEREARLEQVHQLLVGVVERDGGAVLARAELRARLLAWGAPLRHSQAAASFA